MSIGVRFFGPTLETPHRKPRMHNVLPNSRAYGYWLEKRARAIGVDIRTSRRATRLVIDSGRRGLAKDVLSIEQGPFYAMGPVSCFAMGTDTGLAINEQFQILRGDGLPIPGLFGAGTVGLGGLMAEGHGHHLGWAFTSGRLAGRNAAHLARTADAEPKK